MSIVPESPVLLQVLHVINPSAVGGLTKAFDASRASLADDLTGTTNRDLEEGVFGLVVAHHPSEVEVRRLLSSLSRDPLHRRSQLFDILALIAVLEANGLDGFIPLLIPGAHRRPRDSRSSE